MDVDLNRLARGLKMIIDRLTPKPIDNVICEIATDKTMLKFKGNAFDIDKLLLSFVEFVPHSFKAVQSIDVFLDISEALCFCQDILSGKIPKLALTEVERCKKEKIQYPNEVYTSPLGGVNEEKAKKRGLRTDGKAISRLFKLSPGSKADFLFTAEQRAGHTDPKKKKLIVPEGPIEQVIRVGCTKRELKAIALSIQMHIEAYTTSKYANNGYARKPKEE